MSEELFRKLPTTMSVSDKITYHILRYSYNYFLEIDLNGISSDIEEYVKPLVPITKENFNKIPRDHVCKVKKMKWCLDNEDDYTLEFKRKHEFNLFTSVKQAELEAAEIYKNHCSSYKSSKATVYSEGGVKRVKRKEPDQIPNYMDEIYVDNVATSTRQNELTKETLLQMLADNFQFVRDVMEMNDETLIEKLNEDNESNIFVKQIENYSEPTNKAARIADYIISHFHKKITDS